MSISYCFDCDRYIDTDEDGEFDHDNNRCGSCTEKDPHGKKIRDCVEDHKIKQEQIDKAVKAIHDHTRDNMKHLGFDVESICKTHERLYREALMK